MTTSIDTPCAERLAALLPEAASRARARQRRILVSVTESVASADLLDGLEAAARSGDAVGFWTHPVDDSAIGAVGAAITFTPVGAGRFAAVDGEWTTLLGDAVVDDASDGFEATGPILVGGFAFDPAGPAAAHWRDFGSTRLTVPRLHLTGANGSCWLTATLVVSPDGTPDMSCAELGARRDAFVAGLAPRAAHPARGMTSLGFEDEPPVDAWRALVDEAVAAIGRGEMQKVVVARSRHARAEGGFDEFAALRHLRDAYPACYVFGWWSGDSVFIGASPERLVRLDGEEVQVSSLAGSAPRGSTPREDAELANALLRSAKDRSEHALVRDALVAALSTLCDSVSAPTAPTLFALPQVHHLHTAIRARLRAGGSLLRLVEALHPTPAVGGAPRDRALEFLAAREPLDRGWYAAPVGWVGRTGGEFAVALRSALVTRAQAWLYAGCGIVAGSRAESEYAETLLKLRPMERALAIAAGGPA
jgi:isochorismate synthase